MGVFAFIKQVGQVKMFDTVGYKEKSHKKTLRDTKLFIATSTRMNKCAKASLRFWLQLVGYMLENELWRNSFDITDW